MIEALSQGPNIDIHGISVLGPDRYLCWRGHGCKRVRGDVSRHIRRLALHLTRFVNRSRDDPVVLNGDANESYRDIPVFVLPIIINTSEGIKSVPKRALEPAHSFGASQRFVVTRVKIPHAIPPLMSGSDLPSDEM